MQPTHQPKKFSASRIFTDRDDARADFLEAVQTAQAREDYRILNWYGVGGQGKSKLCEELQYTLQNLQEQHPILSVYRDFRSGCVTFEDATMRQLETATLALRLQLAHGGGMSFPAFDVAFARYFTLINPGVDMRERYPELFGSDNEILDDVIEWAKDLFHGSTTVASFFLPGANIIYKYSARLAGRLKEWWDRRGKLVLEGLDDLNADQVRQRLPTYLGADLCDNLAASPATRLVIFLDTYEALWKDRGTNADYSGLRVDEWVRRLVQESPGVLFVIFGRDAIHWEEINPDWSPVLSHHSLNELSDKDALRFLKSVPINDDEICQRIVRSSRGLPFYLNLQVDLYETLLNAGNVPAPAQFGGSHPEILARFFDHLSKEELELRLASYPRILDEKIMASLMDRFLGGSAMLDWKSFCSWSFINSISGDRVAMHALMRDALQANELERRPAVFHDVHRYLANLFDEMAKVDQGAGFDVESDALIIAAAEHLTLAAPKEFPAWFNKRWEALWSADRYRVLKRVLEKALSQESCVDLWQVKEQGDLLFDLGEVLRKQGNSEDAKTCFEKSLALYRSIEESIDKTEIAETLVYLSDVLGLDELDRREALLKEAANILANSPNASLERRIECETTLGEIARLRGNSDATRNHYEAALELLRQKSVALNSNDPQPSLERMEWLELMGRVNTNLEHLEDAERDVKTALEYADALLGPLDLRTVDIARQYFEVVYISAQQDSFETAFNFVEGRLREVQKFVGETHPIVLQYLDDAAVIRNTQTRFQDELDILYKCLKIAITIYGEDSVQVRDYRIRMMAPLVRTGAFEACIEIAEAVDLDRLLKLETIEKWKDAAVQVAAAYYLSGRSETALELLNKGIELFDEIKIKHSDLYVGLLQERAEAYMQLGNKHLALQDSNQQVILTRELKQPLPIVLAASYTRHASILARLGEYSEAVAFFREAVEIIDRNYDELTPLLLQILSGLESCLRSLGLDNEAREVEQRRLASFSSTHS